MKAYTIGHLADQLGVGRETLRHYENQKLIFPKRNEGNRYRYFDDLDGLNVLHTKLLQSYELPLSQIQENMRFWTLEQQEAYLVEYERKLRLDLVALQKRLDRIRRMRGFIDDSQNRIGTFWEAELNGLYKILILGDNVVSTPHLRVLVRQWSKKFPITDIGWHIRLEDARQGNDRIPVAVGLTVIEEYVQPHQFDIAPPVIHFPGGHSVRTILAVRNPFDLHFDEIKPLFDYVDSKGYRIISDLTGRYGGCEYEQGAAKYFFTLRVIIEKT